MFKKGSAKKILVGITGTKSIHWRNKLKEVEKSKIAEVALFLEYYKKSERKIIYQALLKSSLKKIPLVHIRNDMKKEELELLARNFKTKYFTIHEDGFNFLKNWQGYHQKLYLELNYDNFISKKIDIYKIGGFCLDLSHFKVEEAKYSKEFYYILQKRKNKKLFACNHLNGYSYKDNIDLHNIKSLKDFNYLKTLPGFLIGNIIALETFNTISEQLKFKKYLIKIIPRQKN
jgi:hypothetical protein